MSYHSCISRLHHSIIQKEKEGNSLYGWNWRESALSPEFGYIDGSQEQHRFTGRGGFAQQDGWDLGFFNSGFLVVWIDGCDCFFPHKRFRGRHADAPAVRTAGLIWRMCMRPAAIRTDPRGIVVAEGRVAIAVMGESPGEPITARIYFPGCVSALRNHVKKLRPSFIRGIFFQTRKDCASIRCQARSDINRRTCKRPCRQDGKNKQNSSHLSEHMRYPFFFHLHCLHESLTGHNHTITAKLQSKENKRLQRFSAHDTIPSRHGKGDGNHGQIRSEGKAE